ncbi:aldo/keto reductase [Synechococcus sp. ATX 2A4]|uniref:aldo/keto reductase n=1 Tax=Synechococcus sp. ATX 2A4 TaxID=2823727 RepID=UPI0020CF83D8|nr:aldo/keto reductase [Synechococcus sp. ATX 2A4]MCP9886307.1 aldo/keto reductase [Synechococcus sp. ATX 2A4]
MQFTRLGRTGLEVSRICLGCMSFGVPDRGSHEWTIDEEQSRPILRAAWEAGINFFDTANVYSLGSSEEIVGKVLKELGPRDEQVIATKVHGEMRPGPNGKGLSRKVILHQIDESLRRLGTDYVDLYQIHRFDAATPIEETLEALNDVVRAGKARYIGASSMAAWQFLKMVMTSERHGWAKFVSMQNQLNLIEREEEREMLPLCIDKGIGVIPWSPLARGRLTRPWDESTFRTDTDLVTRRLYKKTEEANRAVNGVVGEIAAERGAKMAQVALAWVLQKQPVTAPILGVTKLGQLADGLAALDLQLSADEVARLEANYQPTGERSFL